MQYIEPVGAQGPANAYGHDYVDKNAGAGIAGSFLAADVPEHTMLELVALIDKSSLPPSGSDLQQVSKAVRSQRLNYIAAVGGTANALTITLDPAPADYAALTGTPLRLLISDTNTGPATLNVNGLGAKTINRIGGATLQPGDMPASAVIELVYDGTGFQVTTFSPSTALARGSLIAIRVYSAPGSTPYVPTTGTKRVRVTVQGGGGAGGGCVDTTSTSNFGGGGGGGSGGCGISDISAGFAGATVTVGAAGAAAVGVAGGAGGTSSFGSFVSATGGAGGAPGAQTATATVQAGGLGGASTGANVSNNKGASGGIAVSFTNTNLSSGFGAASEFGAGGNAVFTTNAPGLAASSYGSAGGGAVVQGGVAAQPGGNGAVGVVIVEEYA